MCLYCCNTWCLPQSFGLFALQLKTEWSRNCWETTLVATQVLLTFNEGQRNQSQCDTCTTVSDLFMFHTSNGRLQSCHSCLMDISDEITPSVSVFDRYLVGGGGAGGVNITIRFIFRLVLTQWQINNGWQMPWWDQNIKQTPMGNRGPEWAMG